VKHHTNQQTNQGNETMNANLTDHQISLLKSWLSANKTVPGWLDGYPLGTSYIDTRAAKGSKRDGRAAYVKLDHQVAREVPQFRGMLADEIESILSNQPIP
jgi:hypothetical protein